MSRVFVIDASKQPLNPIHPAKARILLREGEAAVFKLCPFTIILRNTYPRGEPQPLRLKLDPGSHFSGLALVDDSTGEVAWAAELEHRGQQIKSALGRRHLLRRGRRYRKCRYRARRFNNRRCKAGWLAPSLQSRVDNVLTWVRRIRRNCPIRAISLELVRFDTQLMQDPEISGVEYQQGGLQGYEVREYLLEKWGRKCSYCGKEARPLQIEHIIPRSRGGSDRVSNLCLACESCNLRKGNRTAEEFGHPEVQSRAKQPLRDAAVLNSTRWALYRRLAETDLPVEVGSGGLTKYNRVIKGLPKAHWIDAACTGKSTPRQLKLTEIHPLRIRAVGRGNRQVCGTDKYGFPIRHRSRKKVHFGLMTGDLVEAVIPAGTSKYAGIEWGRVTVRARAYVRLNGHDVNVRYCRLLQRADGYDYIVRRKLGLAKSTEIQPAKPEMGKGSKSHESKIEG